MRAPIKELCTGEPPGEFTSSATAAGFPLRKAFSSTGANEASDIDPRPAIPMAPDRRTMATQGGFLVKGRRSFMGADVECAPPVNKGPPPR